jgi:multidrug resistance efflux pump
MRSADGLVSPVQLGSLVAVALLVGPVLAEDRVVLEAKGYIVPAHPVRVSPGVAGKIVWLHEKFEEGTHYKEGEVVARLEDDEYRADLDKARAALDRARARLAGPDVAATPAGREVAKADVAEAEAAVRKAKWRLDSCVIRAPLSGTVLSKKAQVGEVVSPSTYQLAATLCEMADLSDLRIDVDISNIHIAKLAVGQKCTVTPDAFATDLVFLKRHPAAYTATLDRILPVGDRARGSVTARVKIARGQIPAEEHGIYLKPETSVLIEFRMGN